MDRTKPYVWGHSCNFWCRCLDLWWYKIVLSKCSFSGSGTSVLVGEGWRLTGIMDPSSMRKILRRGLMPSTCKLQLLKPKMMAVSSSSATNKWTVSLLGQSGIVGKILTSKQIDFHLAFWKVTSSPSGSILLHNWWDISSGLIKLEQAPLFRTILNRRVLLVVMPMLVQTL